MHIHANSCTRRCCYEGLRAGVTDNDIRVRSCVTTYDKKGCLSEVVGLRLQYGLRLGASFKIRMFDSGNRVGLVYRSAIVSTRLSRKKGSLECLRRILQSFAPTLIFHWPRNGPKLCFAVPLQRGRTGPASEAVTLR